MTHRPAMSPSGISTLMCLPVRSRASSSARAVWRLLHELPRHRGPARRAGTVDDGFADWLGDPGVPAGRDTGEHPLQHHLRQQVISGEVPVGLQRHLMTIDGPGPRPGHRNPTTAQGHRAFLGAVPHGRAGLLAAVDVVWRRGADCA